MQLWIDARMVACSGIGTVLKNLIPPLASSPFQTTLILHPNEEKKERWLAEYSRKNCSAGIYSLKEQVSLPWLIDPCDLFWSPHYNIPVFPIAAKKRVVTIHDAFHLAFIDSLGWKERLYAKAMFRQAVQRSDAILTDSEFSQGELHRLLSIDKNRIRVVYPGVDVARFSNESADQEAVRAKYALPPRFFLFVGNVKPHKNLRLILDAYERRPIEIPLVIVGKKEGLRQKDDALHRIESSPRIKSHTFAIGEVHDLELPAIYQMATALVFPSLYEGFGLPPLEAMAANCPVIASYRASLPEICGDAAHFVHRNDPNELADAMEQIAQDAGLRQSLREKGKRRAKSFSWETTASEYRKIFQEIHFS